MANIGIIGYGYVGEATGRGFETNKKNKVYWYDKYKAGPHTLDDVVAKSEFIFVSVPTPMFRDYSGSDMTIVQEVGENIAKKIAGTKKVLIIKSSVLPGFTKKLGKKFPKTNLVMNPEFLTQRNAVRDFLNPQRTVIGSSKKANALKVKKLYETILPKKQQYFLMDETSAEITKFMSNLMNAAKILLANEFYFFAKRMGVNYDGVREAVQADSRVGEFMKVPGWDGDFGFGQACFPKDMIGFLAFAKEKKVDMSALEAVWKKNLKIRKKRDWEGMDNAFGRGASKVAKKNDSKKART